MTRKLLYDALKTNLEKEGIELTDESRAAVDAAVFVTLEYIQNYGLMVAEELAIQRAYSELHVAGLFLNKVKGLMK